MKFQQSAEHVLNTWACPAVSLFSLPEVTKRTKSGWSSGLQNPVGPSCVCGCVVPANWRQKHFQNSYGKIIPPAHSNTPLAHFQLNTPASVTVHSLPAPPGGSEGEKSTCQCRRCRIIPLHWEGPLEEVLETHPSFLAWKISWTEEPGSYSPWYPKKLDVTEHFIVWMCTIYFSIQQSIDILVISSLW